MKDNEHYRTESHKPLKVTDEIKRDAAHAFGAHEALQWLTRADSNLSQFTKVQVQQEMEKFFKSKGIEVNGLIRL